MQQALDVQQFLCSNLEVHTWALVFGEDNLLACLLRHVRLYPDIPFYLFSGCCLLWLLLLANNSLALAKSWILCCLWCSLCKLSFLSLSFKCHFNVYIFNLYLSNHRIWIYTVVLKIIPNLGNPDVLTTLSLICMYLLIASLIQIFQRMSGESHLMPLYPSLGGINVMFILCIGNPAYSIHSTLFTFPISSLHLYLFSILPLIINWDNAIYNDDIKERVGFRQ